MLTTRRPQPPSNNKGEWNSRTSPAPLPRYDPLFDTNLVSHYQKRGVREQLFAAHLIDKSGRVLHLDKTKLNLIDKGFSSADLEEEKRKRDDQFERKKLESRKCIMKGHLKRVMAYRTRREVEMQRRAAYNYKIMPFTPAPSPGAGAALTLETPLETRPPKGLSRTPVSATPEKLTPSLAPNKSLHRSPVSTGRKLASDTSDASSSSSTSTDAE
eukprot:Sspe_Gene.15261::Locus_5302_Transcript_1_1_Confidence_1.000_Length_1029::g.15261::m.15261